MNKSALVLLDSSFVISQNLQLISIKNYAEKNKLNISFYGNERVGYENRHDIFKEYLEKNNEKNYIFFTINQFIKDDILKTKLLKKAIQKGIKLHFSNENIMISKESDLLEIKLLLISKFCSKDFKNQNKIY